MGLGLGQARLKHRRRERAEALAILDPEIERLLHRGIARIAEV
jgi:hypothetical protein